MSESELVRAEDLEMSIAEVRHRWPRAVEYVALDGSPCWRRADLTDAIRHGEDAGEDRP